MISLLEALYSYTTTALAETPEEIFELTVGVRQGGPESPMLYNLYMDFVMRIFMESCKQHKIKFLKLNYKIPASASTSKRETAGVFTIDWCGYADDLSLCFDDEKSLKLGLVILNDTFKIYQLNVNAIKTKTMIFNQQHENKRRYYPTSIASINGKNLENVLGYRYLGCEINAN